MTHWGKDPYSLMSYSYVPVGSSGDVYDAMAKDINETVYFAGEVGDQAIWVFRVGWSVRTD